MPKLQAAEILAEAREGKRQLTADGWYDLTLYVTGDVRQAQKALYDYISREQNAGRKPV